MNCILGKIIYVNGLWLGVGIDITGSNKGLYYSTDGINWTPAM
jgi:hypothetical protein